MSSSWDKVTGIDQFSISLESGVKEAKIYGNSRNCVAVNLTFSGKHGTEDIDISGQDLSDHVQLITYEGSEPLPFGSVAHGANTLFYSKEKSDYYLPPITRRGSKLDLRAKVTFYVYAKADRDFIMMISARFNLHSNQTVDFSSGNSLAQFLKIDVSRPIVYHLEETAPIEWILESEQGPNKVYTAFFRPKDRSRFWLNHEFFENKDKPDGLEFICRISRGTYYYQYFVCPLGNQMTTYFQRLPNIHRTAITYNQEAGALTLIKIAGRNEDCDVGDQNFIEQFSMKLYDQFGNVGAFKFTFENPYYPNLETISPDFY